MTHQAFFDALKSGNIARVYLFSGEEEHVKRSALKRRIPFTLHNDTMVTPIDPLMSVWSAVNRLTSSGKVLGAAQRIGVLDALKSVTIWGAYQYHEEHYKGSLEPGKLADMVILDTNPLTADPIVIKDIKVLATIVGDECVYGEV